MLSREFLEWIVIHVIPAVAILLQGWRIHNKITEVHLMVNSRLDRALTKITALERALRDAKDPRE